MTFFEKFKNLTNIDIGKFYAELADFYENYHNDILNYYIDYNFSYPADAFAKYYSIQKQLNTIISKIVLYKGNFDTIDIWGVVENLDSIKFELDNVPEYPRLYQVSFYKKQNQNENIYETYILKSHDTIETVARDYKQDTTDLVLINELNEEKWTDKGGTKIILKTSTSDAIPYAAKADTVFDILIGKNLLGKDLPKYFEIDEEIEDLKVLTPEQTFLQSVQVLFELKKGEIPEFSEIGVDKSIYGECTKGNIGYTFPIMIRQLNIALETDDTILNFVINDIELDEKNNSYIIYASVQNMINDNLKFITTLE